MDRDDATNIDLTATRRAVEQAHSDRSADAGAKEELVPREYTVELSYALPGGTARNASMVSRIMSGDDRIKMARYCSALAADAGASFNMLPTGFQERFHMLAWCMTQLREMPDWVVKTMSEDTKVLTALYEEVERHERTYFPPDSSEGGGTARERRVVVSSPYPPSPTKK